MAGTRNRSSVRAQHVTIREALGLQLGRGAVVGAFGALEHNIPIYVCWFAPDSPHSRNPHKDQHGGQPNAKEGTWEIRARPPYQFEARTRLWMGWGKRKPHR